MNLPDVLLLFTLYTLVVAAAATLFIYFSARRPRTPQRGLPVPNVAGLKLKPINEGNIVSWPGRETPEPAPRAIDVEPISPINVMSPANGASPANALSPGSMASASNAGSLSPVMNAGGKASSGGSASPNGAASTSSTLSAGNAASPGSASGQGGAVVPVAPATPAVPVSETRDDVLLPSLAGGGGEPDVSEDSYAETSLVNSLAEIFAPRGPLLPEGLRTLQVTPNRSIEPATAVQAAFTFRNLGGGTGSGFRVRFRLPDGLTYLAGSARIDDTPLEEQDGLTALLLPSGADIGEIPAGGERRVAISYRVAETIENGTVLTVQAAIASADVPVIGSNIVRLVVHSRPVLQNANTTLALVPVREALPGEELQLNARVHNSGQSTAHDLVVLLPLPAHTRFSPRSITIEGRSVAAGSESEPFGFARPTVVARTLGPGATIDIGYRVRIDTPLEDGTPILASGAVCSLEVAEFPLTPVVVKIPSAASFAGEDSALQVECEDEVEPGERVRIVLRARNTGTAPARKLSLRIALPEGMVYTAGSLAIDGAPSPDRGAVPDAIRLGDLEPGHVVELALSATVQSPIADGHELRINATIAWSKGQRKFDRSLSARSAPRFPSNFNRIERETLRRVGPGDAVAFTISLQNMGTDTATDVRLQLIADEGLERLRVYDREAAVVIGDGATIALDTLEPGVSRVLRVDGRVAGVIEDQTQLRLHAALLTLQVPRVELGAPEHVVESRPRFSVMSSYLAANTDEAVRLTRMTSCRLLLANEGTDCGRDVRVAVLLPEELRLERVDAATIDGNAVVFGDIPAGETREAELHMRLVGTVAAGEILTISARVSGLNVVPFTLRPIELATRAEASFTEGATLTSVPADTIDAGAEIAYTLTLRNWGDGTAKHLTTRLAMLSNAVYAQGSTTINGIALQDFAGTSPLLGDAGLRLADVGAGVEVIVRWRVIVNMPLPPATFVEAVAGVRWDEVPEMSVAAAPVPVRSTSALPIIEPELPFSVLGAVAAPTRSSALATTRGGEAGGRKSSYVGLRRPVPVRTTGANASGQGLSNGYGTVTRSISSGGHAQLAPGNGKAEPQRKVVISEISDDLPDELT